MQTTLPLKMSSPQILDRTGIEYANRADCAAEKAPARSCRPERAWGMGDVADSPDDRRRSRLASPRTRHSGPALEDVGAGPVLAKDATGKLARHRGGMIAGTAFAGHLLLKRMGRATRVAAELVGALALTWILPS
jgi:hypothetical protein